MSSLSGRVIVRQLIAMATVLAADLARAGTNAKSGVVVSGGVGLEIGW